MSSKKALKDWGVNELNRDVKDSLVKNGIRGCTKI